MSATRIVFVAVAIVALTTGLRAQQTAQTRIPTGDASVKTEQLTGEVIFIDGNELVAKMQPDGVHRVFKIAPGRQFIIDGQTKLINELKPGTILTATVTTTTQPIAVRTTTIVNGTVWWVDGNYVVLHLENGESKGYTVPDLFRFTSNGKEVSVKELRKGMKVSATKIVEEPSAQISTTAVITGKAPK